MQLPPVIHSLKMWENYLEGDTDVIADIPLLSLWSVEVMEDYGLNENHQERILFFNELS